MAAGRIEAGHEVTVEWQGRRVRAWVPDPLARRSLRLSERTARLTEQAIAAVLRSREALPARWEPMARLLLREEGIASSFIEGVRAPLADVLAAELEPTEGEPATWVARNLETVLGAIAEAPDGPLTAGTLHRWHRRLMAGAHYLPADLIGAWRDRVGWIGGTGPHDAALVVAPPQEVPGLMDDLIAFANREDLDAVTQAAIAHTQFEVIHPYADGNGRVGRVLIAWILARRLGLDTTPPVSLRIALDRGGYLSALTLFRLGDVERTVAWFATTVRDAAEATIGIVAGVGELSQRWEQLLTGVRQDAAARRLLAMLPERPVLSAATVAEGLGISERAGRDALHTLAEHRIVEAHRPAGRPSGRPRQWWIARELIDLLGGWAPR